MANIKSAIKRAGVTRKKNLRNRMVTSSVRTQLKRFRQSVEDGKMDEAKAMYASTVKKVDKAAAKGVIHKNAANRKKAQLARAVAAK